MPNNTGIYDVASLIRSRFATQLAQDFGFNQIQEILAQDLAGWNMQVNQMVADLANLTTDRQGITGSSTSVRGQEVDEYGAGHTKEEKPGSTVAFELRRLAYPLGKTTRWMRQATVSDIAIGQQSVRQAHLNDIRMYAKRAIYTSTNATFYDLNVDNFALGIKRFVNADGEPIPQSPLDGTTFDPATHTHYLANTSLDVASADSLINTVIEHSVNAAMRVVIHRADVASWSGLTGFQPAQRVMGVYRNTAAPDVPLVPLDTTQNVNYFLGHYGLADVWVKPWAIQNYAFCYDANAPKPLGFRQETAGQGLQLVQDLMLNPLTTNFYEAVFGFGAYTRTNGAVLQFNNATYQNPTINT